MARISAGTEPPGGRYREAFAAPEAEHRDGATWAQEFGQLPALEQVLRDGGTGMQKGLEQVNAERNSQAKQAVGEQLDHFHVQQEAHRALRRWRGQASRALEQAERAQKDVAKHDRCGLKKTGVATQASRCWQEAEAAMDRWTAAEAAWKKVEPALQPFTAAGDLNTRERAQTKRGGDPARIGRTRMGQGKTDAGESGDV